MKQRTKSRWIAPIALLFLLGAAGIWMSAKKQQPAYRDLNKNGKMDVYEDKSQPIEKRISDLLSQMNLEEKAGMLFINGAFIKEDGSMRRLPV